MTIRRDAHGVPWVRAAFLADVAYEQGWACAQDRAWQLDLERRRGEGRTAELLGVAGLTWDVFARRAEIAETAVRAYAALPDETRDFVSAYVDGVNDAFTAGVRAPELSELNELPGTWKPWTPLAVFWVQHVLFGSFPSKLWSHHARGLVGEDTLTLLRREGVTGGSNAFVIGHERSETGSPIVAGDPHRILEDPNIYLQVRLTGIDDGFDVIGLAFAGVPGIHHFGHAERVAWAITNAVADAHDIRAETPESLALATTSVETVPVRGGEPVTFTRRRTRHGPIVIDEPAEAISLRTPPDVLDDLGFPAFPSLLRARCVADVETAFDSWVEPVNNVVTADVAGRASHFVAGRVPVRGPDGWTGWVTDLPHREVAADGIAVTANHRATSAYTAIGTDFAPTFRADRMEFLLEKRRRHTPDSAAAVLLDVQQTAGAVLLALIEATTDLPAGAADVRDRLARWDRRMVADSADAALYADVRDEVVVTLCDSAALASLREPAPYDALFEPWFALAGRVAASLHNVLAVPTPFGLDRDDVVRDALISVARRRDGIEVSAEPRWGARHVFHALHGRAQFGLDAPLGPATQLGGDSDCVMMTGSVLGTPLSVQASVARFVWNLADRRHSLWVVPLGVSGLRTSAHHSDQHEHWVAGTLLPALSTHKLEGPVPDAPA